MQSLNTLFQMTMGKIYDQFQTKRTQTYPLEATWLEKGMTPLIYSIFGASDWGTIRSGEGLITGWKLHMVRIQSTHLIILRVL